MSRVCSPVCVRELSVCDSDQPGESKGMSLDGIQEGGGPERHVKFNIDFDEWRLYHPQPNFDSPRRVGNGHHSGMIKTVTYRVVYLSC